MEPVTLAISLILLFIGSISLIAVFTHRITILMFLLKIKPLNLNIEPVYFTKIGSIENEIMLMILYYTAYLQNENQPLEYPIEKVFEYYAKKRDTNLDSFIVFERQLCFISNWDSVPVTQSLLDMHVVMLKSLEIIP